MQHVFQHLSVIPSDIKCLQDALDNAFQDCDLDLTVPQAISIDMPYDAYAEFPIDMEFTQIEMVVQWRGKLPLVFFHACKQEQRGFRTYASVTCGGLACKQFIFESLYEDLYDDEDKISGDLAGVLYEATGHAVDPRQYYVVSEGYEDCFRRSEHVHPVTRILRDVAKIVELKLTSEHSYEVSRCTEFVCPQFKSQWESVSQSIEAGENVLKDTVSLAIAHPDVPERRASTRSIQILGMCDRLKKGTDCAGIIFWEYDGKAKWKINDVEVQTGCVYILPTSALVGTASEKEQVHGKLYKQLFGEEYDNKLFASGFSYHQEVWKFNSSLNMKEHEAFGRSMSPRGQFLIFQAIAMWMVTGNPTCPVGKPIPRGAILRAPSELRALFGRGAASEIIKEIDAVQPLHCARCLVDIRGEMQRLVELMDHCRRE